MTYLLITMLLLVGADLFTKYLAILFWKPDGFVNIIPHVLSFTYVENRGAAFGLMQNARWFFIVLALIGVGVIIWYVLRRPRGMFIRTSLAFIAAGALGNGIDRLVRGYVVDFIKVHFFDFPCFNIADICITTGAVLLLIFVLFLEKKELENGAET